MCLLSVVLGRCIIIESPDRFARDVMVQLAGYDMLKAKGVILCAA
jgi:hypothetical protein